MLNEKIKVGIIIDEGEIPFLVWDFIEKYQKNNIYQITTLFIQQNTNASDNYFKKIILYIKSYSISSIIQSVLWKSIEIFEKFLIKIFYPNLFKVFKNKRLKDFELKKVYLNPTISKSGLYYRFSEDQIQKIKKEKINLLIRGGSGILKGEILNAVDKGILSFHHGDNDINRGGPPGFWEVYFKQSYSGFIVQRLSEELDGGNVIFKGKIQTAFFYTYNKCRLYLKSVFFLDHAIKSVLKNESSRKYPKIPYSYRLFKKPKLTAQFLYLFQTIFFISVKIFKRIFSIQDRWGVGFQFVESLDNLSLRKSVFIKNLPSKFFADPFIISENNKHILFVEEYDYKKNKGVISAIEVFKNKSYKYLGPVIQEEYHLSYPHIFREGKDIFMCPESYQNNEIAIYKCISFPLKWEKHKVLIKNIRAVDTNIFYLSGRWWILTTVCSSQIDEFSSEMHIYSSTELNSETWVSHPMNPIFVDSNMARNGGKIHFIKDKILRVHQKQTFNMYGKELLVSEIKILNNEKYEEKYLYSITPNFIEKIKGIHTLNFDKSVATFDFAKSQKI